MTLEDFTRALEAQASEDLATVVTIRRPRTARSEARAYRQHVIDELWEGRRFPVLTEYGQGYVVATHTVRGVPFSENQNRAFQTTDGYAPGRVLGVKVQLRGAVRICKIERVLRTYDPVDTNVEPKPRKPYVKPGAAELSRRALKAWETRRAWADYVPF